MDEEEIDNLQERKEKVKNLKVFKVALGVLACVTALVQNPIMVGVSFAANLGTIIAESAIDSINDVESNVNVGAKPVSAMR